ncbi:hypothetical protein Tco_1124873 [Tanacetum coccineum]|uniref:Uncharacterized protein n=1 Tax=Tanacetum coccineum TaxID=301880 RepID=A0ABQ5JA90_9ASTR
MDRVNNFDLSTLDSRRKDASIIYRSQSRNPRMAARVLLMVDSSLVKMVNTLVSGEEYDKVFNHLDMLNAPFEEKVSTTAKSCGDMAWKFKGNLDLRGRLFHLWKSQLQGKFMQKIVFIIFMMDHVNNFDLSTLDARRKDASIIDVSRSRNPRMAVRSRIMAYSILRAAKPMDFSNVILEHKKTSNSRHKDSWETRFVDFNRVSAASWGVSAAKTRLVLPLEDYYCLPCPISDTTYCLVIVLMVDSVTFDQEMVNTLVSGEEYDKVFNHLDMLNAPFKEKVFTTAKSCGDMAWTFKGNLELRGRLFHSWKSQLQGKFMQKIVLSSSNREDCWELLI